MLSKTGKLVIRETTSQDTDRVLALYPQAFPGEELRPVVTALLEREEDVLSLAACDNGKLLGHLLFTFCGTMQNDRTAALLGPLGVIPALQRQGLGSSLVRTGLGQLQNSGIKQVFVLGDPDYYGRFGFLPERQVSTPYTVPEQWADAWQSTTFAGHTPPSAGRLLLPEPWMQPALWGK